MQKWIILIVVCVLVILGGIVFMNFHVETEYVPEAELEDRELRKTIVVLYFQNKETKELAKESRLIDSKTLLKEPYQTLLEMLLQGPENSNYEKVIPEHTQVLQVTQSGDTAIVDLSNAFVEESTDDTQRYNAVYSIVSTLTELTEINGVKIMIDGKEIDGFVECGLDFKQTFTKATFQQ